MTAATTPTFESYLSFAEKALKKSRKSIDTRALIQLAYGEETAHIGGSDMLVGILDSVLDKIANETVIDELKSYGTKGIEEKTNDDESAILTGTTPQERLDKIDQAVLSVREWEEKRDRIEEMDAKSARGSIQQNLLPEGVTMEDVIAYREHEQRLQAKNTLQLELQRIQDEILALQKQSTERENTIREQLGRVETVERELGASANVCAMVTNWALQIHVEIRLCKTIQCVLRLVWSEGREKKRKKKA